jgi:hypothetical protein
MATPEFLDVDAGELHLPPSRMSGAEPVKLQRQIAKHGKSTAGMPRLFVLRATDGVLVVYDGVTRATRVAKLLPGQIVPVEVIDSLPSPAGHCPKVKDRLP